MIDRIKEIKNIKEAKNAKAHINDLREVMHSRKVLPRGICGITSNKFGHTHIESAKIFIDSGIRMVEYGEADSPLAEEAIEIKRLCNDHGAFFVIHEGLDAAVARNADGIHLNNSAKIREVKEQFSGTIGVSVANLGEAFKAQESGADYLMVGAMFSTDKKTDMKIVPFNEFRRIREKISLPIYAIGGIKYENVQLIKRIGADGVALTGDILAATEVSSVIGSIIAAWSKS